LRSMFLGGNSICNRIVIPTERSEVEGPAVDLAGSQCFPGK